MLLLRRQNIPSGKQIDGGSNKSHHACSVMSLIVLKTAYVSSSPSKVGNFKHQVYEVTALIKETLHIF